MLTPEYIELSKLTKDEAANAGSEVAPKAVNILGAAKLRIADNMTISLKKV